jgi:dephospho-CoA kinase
MFFSIIIPVYNRPQEIDELLDSLTQLTYKEKFEVVVVEDGSVEKCNEVIDKYKNKLEVSYHYKDNSGPGDSRNFGMTQAKGDYFIIFDSDCIIPNDYLDVVSESLKYNYVDCFGGPDSALKSFNATQKAINFAMTSFITTGGIRGGSERLEKFQPRSFNMGLSKSAFFKSGGFSNIHPGEDPDLSIRLWKLGFETQLFQKAYVFHKRRISFEMFYRQVRKFGKARPILDYWYPEYSKLTFLLPSIFTIGFFASILLLFLTYDIVLKLYFIYFFLVFAISSFQNKKIYVGLLSIKAVFIQFFGYGLAFLESFYKINMKKVEPHIAFPDLFFHKKQNFIEETNPDLTNPDLLIDSNNNKDSSKQPMKQKIIGLTGGIGSGKSTVAKLFAELGIPVYISDIEGKKVMQFPHVIDKITKLFGDTIIDEKGLNRELIASIVFNNKEKLEQLNSIVHPEVKNHFDNWVLLQKEAPVLVKESAILFETSGNIDCFKTISVTAPLEDRIQRVIKRDKSTKEAVMKRISNQLSDDVRNAKSDYVIENIDQSTLKSQVQFIVNEINNL